MSEENPLFGMICEDCGTTENVSTDTGLCADCEELEQWENEDQLMIEEAEQYENEEIEK